MAEPVTPVRPVHQVDFDTVFDCLCVAARRAADDSRDRALPVAGQ